MKKQTNLYRYMRGSGSGSRARRYLVLYEIADDSGSCLQYRTIRAASPMAAREKVQDIPDAHHLAITAPWTETYMVWACRKNMRSVKHWQLYEDEPPSEPAEHYYRVSYPVKKKKAVSD